MADTDKSFMSSVHRNTVGDERVHIFPTYGKKKRNIHINCNTNYCREMKLIPINMVYFLLKFDALNVFLGISLHGVYLPNFNFFNLNSQILQRNRKVHLSNCLVTNFHNISIISLRVIRRRNYS